MASATSVSLASVPPEWLHCGRDATADDPLGCLGIHVSGHTVCLAHLNDADRSAYLTGLRPGADIDHRGTPFTEELLRRLLGALTDPDTNRPRFGDAWFDRATFSGDARFARVEFSGNAHFAEARFSGDAWFNEAKFNGDTVFIEAKFKSHALFTEAMFSNHAWFYDANASLSHRISQNHRLTLKAYRSEDYFLFADDFGYDWSNNLATLSLNSILTDDFFSRLTSSAYKYESSHFDPSIVDAFRLENGISYFRAHQDLLYTGLDRHTLNAGFEWTRYRSDDESIRRRHERLDDHRGVGATGPRRAGQRHRPRRVPRGLPVRQRPVGRDRRCPGPDGAHLLRR
jgi:hypothetical protein